MVGGSFLVWIKGIKKGIEAVKKVVRNGLLSTCDGKNADFNAYFPRILAIFNAYFPRSRLSEETLTLISPEALAA